MAEFEAAAVQAFSHLSDELEAHGLHQHAGYALVAATHEVRAFLFFSLPSPACL